jgi:hypothetical protein
MAHSAGGDVVVIYFTTRRVVQKHFRREVISDIRLGVIFGALALVIAFVINYLPLTIGAGLIAILAIGAVAFAIGSLSILVQPLMAQISQASVDECREYLSGLDVATAVQVRDQARVHREGAQSAQVLPNALWAFFLVAVVFMLEGSLVVSPLIVLLGCGALFVLVLSLVWHAESANINTVIEMATAVLMNGHGESEPRALKQSDPGQVSKDADLDIKPKEAIS